MSSFLALPQQQRARLLTPNTVAPVACVNANSTLAAMADQRCRYLPVISDGKVVTPAHSAAYVVVLQLLTHPPTMFLVFF